MTKFKCTNCGYEEDVPASFNKNIKPWCGANRHGVLLDATKNLLKSLKEQYTFEAFLIKAFNLMKAAKSFLSPEDFEELTTYLEKLVQEGKGEAEWKPRTKDAVRHLNNQLRLPAQKLRTRLFKGGFLE